MRGLQMQQAPTRLAALAAAMLIVSLVFGGASKVKAWAVLQTGPIGPESSPVVIELVSVTPTALVEVQVRTRASSQVEAAFQVRLYSRTDRLLVERAWVSSFDQWTEQAFVQESHPSEELQPAYVELLAAANARYELDIRVEEPACSEPDCEMQDGGMPDGSPDGGVPDGSEDGGVPDGSEDGGEDLDDDGIPDEIDEDGDGDGLTDEDELQIYGTDPRNPDTDGGGVDDGMEVEMGLDPNDAEDDAGAFTASGGSLFGCSVTFVGAPSRAWWLLLLLFVFRARFRRL